MDPRNQRPLKIHLVSSADSLEFTHMTQSLTRSSIVALDAEWKPTSTHQSHFPIVTLLQLACQPGSRLVSELDESAESEGSVTFLLDLVSIPLTSIWEVLRDVFVSPDILKLGFRFKQDLVYLSSTFRAQGCDPGFDRVMLNLFLCLFSHQSVGNNRWNRRQSDFNFVFPCILRDLIASFGQLAILFPFLFCCCCPIHDRLT